MTDALKSGNPGENMDCKGAESASLTDSDEINSTSDYDGYYDDILPPDIDEAGENLDKDLVRKIAAVGIGVLLIVSMCVLILYLL